MSINDPNSKGPGGPALDHSELKRLVLLGVLFAAFGVGLWWPAHTHRGELHERIAHAQQELERDLADAQHLPVLHERVERLRDALSGARRYVPREDEVDQLLRDLTQAMQAYSVANPDLIARDTQRFADYSMVPMTLEFRSSFPAAFGVIEQIETMSRLVRIDRLEIEPAQRNALSPVHVRLELSTFFAHDHVGSDASAGEDS